VPVLLDPGRSGTLKADARLPDMSKQPVTQPTPQPAEPNPSPIKDPQPYTDPVKPPPGDPQEDRPLHDPTPPDTDKPRM